MKRSDARIAYAEYSARTSENVRQLAFAALAAIWILRPSSPTQLPNSLLWAGIWAVIALSGDFLQSLYGTVAWGSLHRRKEREGLDDSADFKAPYQINWPTNTLFGAKIVALAICYAILLRYLFSVLT